MATSWSDPNPSGPNAAQLGNAARIDNANIGGIVASILESRARQRALQQQQFQQMLAIAERGAQEYRANQREGSANDAANAAIYGIQNPNDPYGGYADPNRVPDYGGSDALRALESARMMQPDLYESADQKALRQAQIQAQQALAWERYSYPRGSGGGEPEMTPRQQVTTAQDAVRQAQEDYDQYGIPANVLNSQTAIHGPNQTPAYYGPSSVDAADRAKYNTTVPEGQYLIVDPNTGEYNYVTPDYLEKARAAMQQLESAKQGYRSALSGTPTATPGSREVSQNDVAQAAQRMASEKIPYGQEIPTGSPTPSAKSSAMPPASTQMSTGERKTDTPAPANTGIAPSREQAPVGGYYRAPDGSIRRRSN